MIQVALIGSNGRMGSFTQGLLDAADDIEIVSCIGGGGGLGQALQNTKAQVGLDFTRAGLGAKHGRAMLQAGIRPLIGTSGVTPEEDRALDTLSQEVGLGGLVVPNFCLGVWLQQELARTAARYLGSVEIVEEHHASKTDAPSGTAADTAVQLAGVLGCEPEEVPVHSVRLKGLYSNQAVLFGGPGEVLRITHEVFANDAFGPGILAGLRHVASAPPGILRGIGHAFRATST